MTTFSSWIQTPEQGSGPEGEKVLHWYARYTDTQSAAREKRRGILTLKNPIDIKDDALPYVPGLR